MKKLRYLFFLLIISIFVELFLRHMGFGDPITYISSQYKYYPKSNQQNNRYKGAHIKINRLGMRTNSNWDNYTNKNKIIFFGDSVTYGGSYIDNNDLFSEKVCNIFFKKAICGNYGVNGYNIQNIYLRIKDIDKKYYDQIVIVVSSEIENNLSQFKSFPFYKNFDYFFFKASFEVLNHFLLK